jgi:hypothetical protein
MKDNHGSILDLYYLGRPVSLKKLFLFILENLKGDVNLEFCRETTFVVFYDGLIDKLTKDDQDIIRYLWSSLQMDFNCSSAKAAVLRNGLSYLFDIRYYMLDDDFNKAIVSISESSPGCISSALYEFERLGHFIRVTPMQSDNIFEEIGIEDPTTHKLKIDIILRLEKANVSRDYLSSALGVDLQTIDRMFKGNVSNIPIEKLIDIGEKFVGIPPFIDEGV